MNSETNQTDWTAAAATEYLREITARALAGLGASREEAATLSSEVFPAAQLFAAATAVRQKFFGDRAHFCGIVNARSGSCSSDCRYCAQSAHAHTEAPVYPLLPEDELVARAKSAAADGVGCFGIITSGPSATTEEVATICAAVRRIRAETPLAVSGSLGMQSEENLRRLKDAGITRYHHNLETSRAFFLQICTTHSWDARLATLHRARKIGLELCSGALFGLGEVWADRIDLALVLRELAVRSVPLNFLNPVPGTALEHQPPLSSDEALRIIAVYRLLLPEATLRVCGGRPLVLKDQQAEIFAAGANALMTGDYLTTSGITPATDRQMLKDAGFELAAPGS